MRAAALGLCVAALGLSVTALALVDAPVADAQVRGTPGFSAPREAILAKLPETPSGFLVSARGAIQVADSDEKAIEARERSEDVEVGVEAVGADWEVSYSEAGERVALIIVGGTRGEILQSWDGAQVAWPMARGNEGQFGHILNAPYVWLPLSAIFLLGLFDLRRPGRIAHLDLLVLLSFGVSHVFFNAAEIGASSLLVYPPLLYLLARMLWIGFRGAGEGLRPSAPIGLLAVATIFLICFRVAINVSDSGVIDVGYAGVIGAERITSGQPIYGEGAFPQNNPTGDTYGPATYYAYVPFELALPWLGQWDALPAAHAAAIFFDLATIVGLLFLGRRLRSGRAGRDLGVLLAFAWAAYPYTAFALQSNSNDSLVAALLVWALVAFAAPAGRATLLAVAATAKFAALALAPLFVAGERGLAERLEGWRIQRSVLLVAGYAAVVFASVVVLFIMHPAIDPGLAVFWERTIVSQAERESPFSLWGQVPALQPLQSLVAIAAGALAITLAFVPRRRSLVQLAALAAAVLIATQLAVEHWFYLYIPWFFGLVAASIAPPRVPVEERASLGSEDAR